MVVFLSIFVSVWLLVLLTDWLYRHQFKKALRYMVASMRAGHYEVCDEMLLKFPSEEAEIIEQIEVVYQDMRLGRNY